MGKMTVVAPCLYTVGTLNRLMDEVNNVDQLVILQCSNWVMKFMLMQVDTLKHCSRPSTPPYSNNTPKSHWPQHAVPHCKNLSRMTR